MKNKNKEFSKILAALCFLTGAGSIIAYYIAIFKGLYCDPSIAVSGMGQIIGGLLSYCLYQFGLKNSRNKYGIDSDGQPYRNKNIDINEEHNINGSSLG